MKTAPSFALCLLLVFGLEAQASKSMLPRQTDCTTFDPTDQSIFTQACNDAILADPIVGFCAAECQSFYDLNCECSGKELTTQVFLVCGGFRGNTDCPPGTPPDDDEDDTDTDTDTDSDNGAAGTTTTHVSLVAISATLASVFAKVF